MKIEDYPVPSVQLQELLKKALAKKGVQYDQIYDNGSFVYATLPEKRNYMLTVVMGKKNIPVCWNAEKGWTKGSHLHPGIDPANIAKQQLTRLLRNAFR